MLKRISTRALCLALAAACSLSATDKPKPKPMPASTPAAMPPMPKPGPEHAWMRRMDGNWLALVSDHMMTDSKQTPGTWTCKSMGGFWEFCDYSGEMMGAPFLGHQIMGYDMKKKKHTAVWVDSSGDMMMLMEGTATPDGKTTTLWGKGPDMTGKMVNYKWVTSWTDDDHFTFNMYMMKGKNAVLIMDIAYTRKK